MRTLHVTYRFALFGLVCSSILCLSSHAVVLDRLMDRNLAKEANFIFVGQVVDREYQNSEPVDNGEEDAEPVSMPHTFVTFSIEDILKGRLEDADSELITLRFMGGMSTDTEEGFIHLGGSPLLDIGDRGVFFVTRNQERACPLVGWKQGFIYVNEDNQVFNGLGQEISLTQNPLPAARLHPADINVNTLTKPLLSQPREVDEFIYSHLLPATQQLLENPTSIQGIEPIQLSFSLDRLRSVAPFEFSGEVNGEFLMQLMPMKYRQATQSPLQLLLYRDLNLLLTNRFVFSENLLQDVELSEQSRIFLNSNREEMSLEQIVLGNRRILEDVYPQHITKSRDSTIIAGSYQPIPALLNHNTPMGEIDIVLEDSEFEGPQVEPVIPQEELEAKQLTFSNYIAELTDLIMTIHSQAELESLTAIQSADPGIPFTIAPTEPAMLQFDMPGIQPELSDADLAEMQMLQENGGNPVLSQ